MDFEKAYQNFLDGTASTEELEFVRSEMKKASAVNDILNQVKNEGATKSAELESVRKAMKTFRKKDFIKVLIIVCAVTALLAIAAGCAIGIPVFSNAKANMNYSLEQAQQIAVEFVAERFPDGADSIEVYRTEKELDVEGRIKHARYIYVLDVYNGISKVLEIEIDSKTGNIIEVD